MNYDTHNMRAYIVVKSVSPPPSRVFREILRTTIFYTVRLSGFLSSLRKRSLGRTLHTALQISVSIHAIVEAAEYEMDCKFSIKRRNFKCSFICHVPVLRCKHRKFRAILNECRVE